MSLTRLLGRVFGTEKALESAVEAVTNGVDSLVYTDEERATDAAKDRAEGRAMVIKWMEATSGQHLARRLIAVSITGVWLFQYIVSWLSLMVGTFVSGEIREQLIAAAEMTTQHADGMTGAVMLILSFYFAAPHMDKIVGVALNRFGKQ